MATCATDTRAVRAATVLLVALSCTACLPVPLGDPEKSKIDPRFSGVWEWRDDADVHVAVFRPYDDRTWIVDVMTGEPGEGNDVKPKRRSTFKGWLTTVKAETFLTLAPLETVSLLPGEKRQKAFVIARVRIEGDLLSARGLDPEFKQFKDVGTGSELARAVDENLDDVRMYLKEVKATKWPEDQAGRLEKLTQKFSNWK